MGEIAGVNTASLCGYLHSTKTRAWWAEGFHDELNGHVFDLERNGLRQFVLCQRLTMRWQQPTLPYRIGRRPGQQGPRLPLVGSDAQNWHCCVSYIDIALLLHTTASTSGLRSVCSSHFCFSFYTCLTFTTVLSPWEIWVALPRESQLWRSCYPTYCACWVF